MLRLFPRSVRFYGHLRRLGVERGEAAGMSWRNMLARWGFVILALAFLAGPAVAQIPPGPVTPRACDFTTVTTGGTAVNAIASGPVNGYTITNPLTLTDQGIAGAEPLLVNPIGAATAAANVNTIALPPGAAYSGVPLSSGPVSVNAVTSGHKFTCVRW